MKNEEKSQNKVLAAAFKTKEARRKTEETNYGCHTESPYGDGYGDAQYGDYQDA